MTGVRDPEYICTTELGWVLGPHNVQRETAPGKRLELAAENVVEGDRRVVQYRVSCRRTDQIW